MSTFGFFHHIASRFHCPYGQHRDAVRPCVCILFLRGNHPTQAEILYHILHYSSIAESIFNKLFTFSSAYFRKMTSFFYYVFIRPCITFAFFDQTKRTKQIECRVKRPPRHFFECTELLRRKHIWTTVKQISVGLSSAKGLRPYKLPRKQLRVTLSALSISYHLVGIAIFVGRKVKNNYTQSLVFQKLGYPKKLLKYSKDQFEPSDLHLNKQKDGNLEIIIRMN